AGRRLLPYLTANVQFEVARRGDALLVPNASLRWRPRAEWVADAAALPPPAREAGAAKQRGVVWVPHGELVRPVEVQTGPSDGITTEVIGGALKEGTPVVIGVEDAPRE